jgi:hypothetical protein
VANVLRVSAATSNHAGGAGDFQKSFGGFSMKHKLGFAAGKPHTAVSPHGKNFRNVSD